MRLGAGCPALQAVVLAASLSAAPATAYEFGGQNAFRLSDPTERIARANLLDLRERRAGGAFEYNQTTNIDRQINCNFSVSAVGNTAQPTHAAAGVAPVGIQNSGVNASTTGNQSQTSNSSQGVVGDASLTAPLNGGGSGGFPTQQLNGVQTAAGGNLNQVGQGNTGSTLGSAVDSSPLNSQIGNIDARHSEFLNSLDTQQSNQGSEILATVQDAGACEFGSQGS